MIDRDERRPGIALIPSGSVGSHVGQQEDDNPPAQPPDMGKRRSLCIVPSGFDQRVTVYRDEPLSWD